MIKYNGSTKTLFNKLLRSNLFYVVSFNISLSSLGPLRISPNEKGCMQMFDE